MPGSKKKLLIYSADFWPTLGGVQSVVMTLARGFARSGQYSDGVECTVVTETSANPGGDSDLPFRVVRKPNVIQLIRLVRQSDLVHLAGPAVRPLMISFLLGKRIVVEHHGFQTICPNGLLLHEPTRTACPGHFLEGRHRECWKCNAATGYWRSLKLWVLTFLRRWSCRFVAANIAPTHWLERLLRLPRTFMIPHGVAERMALAVPAVNKPQFAFVGRLVSTKGVELLLYASCELMNKGLEFRLLIIGDGPERRNLERLSNRLGLTNQVDFVGEVSDEDMDACLHDTLAVVMPPVAGEVFGLAVAETMMRGRAIIIPDNGALAETAGIAGLKFAPGDAKSLFACMEQILRSPESASELGRQGRRNALERFRADRMLDEHWALYQKVLG